MSYEVETINYHSAETLTTHVVDTWADVIKLLSNRAVLPSSVHVRVIKETCT